MRKREVTPRPNVRETLIAKGLIKPADPATVETVDCERCGEPFERLRRRAEDDKTCACVFRKKRETR